MPLPTVFDLCGDFSACRERTPRRHGLRIACGCVPRRERSLRRSSSPKKVTPRLCCSLVNALATRRLATNFFRYHAVRYCAFSLVGNAHRAFRGEKHGQMQCGRATGKHDIIEKIHNKLFQPMQCPSVERTFCILLYVYGRGRRGCTDPTIQADRFPLVGNAHWAFRGGKRGRMPCGFIFLHRTSRTPHSPFRPSLFCP